MVKTFVQNGMMAVAVSPGYGAGWSTWNYCRDLAYDKRVIELILKYQAKDVTREELAERLEMLGYHDIYCGGLEQICIQWVPLGTCFRIHEYDGSESIETLENMKLIYAGEKV